jgi:hypothetical protein
MFQHLTHYRPMEERKSIPLDDNLSAHPAGEEAKPEPADFFKVAETTRASRRTIL